MNRPEWFVDSRCASHPIVVEVAPASASHPRLAGRGSRTATALSPTRQGSFVPGAVSGVSGPPLTAGSHCINVHTFVYVTNGSCPSVAEERLF